MSQEIPPELKDVCDNYQKLRENCRVASSRIDHQVLQCKLQKLERLITELNIAIEDLNYEVIKQKIELTERDKTDLDNMKIANETIKAFSPYILYFNLCQKMRDGSDAEAPP
jgi:hypothetical protein